MDKIFVLLLFSLKIPWLMGSIYSGTQNICSLSECDCKSIVVECVCNNKSTFQEYLQFRDDRRNLQELILKNCDKIVFPPQSISAGTNLKSINIVNSKQVEFKTESLSVSRLTLLNISSVQSVVFQQQAFQSYNDDSPTVSVHVEAVNSLLINSKAFASIKSLTFHNINNLHLEPSALKLKVPTLEPTIVINMTQVNIKSLSSSAFASSFKHILVKNSTIDRIETNAFSGFLMSHIELEDVDINRIERGAFSDQSVIEILQFNQCKISSIAKKSIVAGISSLMLENSFIQSISKFGAINATVASVRVVNNTFRTLGQESLSVESWNSVIITDNTIQFMEEGALNAIINPIPPTVTSTTPKGVGEVIEADVLFEFTRNEVQNANRHSLVTRLPPSARLVVAENRFSHHCDCQAKQEKYIQSLTGFSGLSSSFQDLSGHLLNSSLCGVPANQRNCFPASDSNSEAHFTPIQEYQLLMCNRDVNSGPPDCILTNVEELDVGGDGNTVGNGVGGAGGVAVYTLNQFYDDFLLLFQVKTTKGILLFLLFCVLCCVCVISICVGTIYIHRLYKRAKLMKSNKLSGSFQFNSQAGEKAEILRYGSNHTSSGCDEDEPQYAEIAEVHHPHDSRVAPASPRDSNKSSDDIEASTMMTTLPKSDEGGTLNGNKSNIATLPLQTSALLSNYAAGMNTLPISSETERLLPMSRYNNGYSGTIGGTPLAQSTPMRKGNGDNGFKLRPGGGVGADSSMRVSMSETSLTDEIMMALRDKLNDPTLYCTVMDAKTGCDQEKGLLGNGKTTHEEELYTAPIYNDPAPKTDMKT